MDNLEHINSHIETVNELEQIVQEYTIKIFEQIKQEAQTYREVGEQLRVLKKIYCFNSTEKQLAIYLFNCIDRLLEKEKNDLSITNRSK